MYWSILNSRFDNSGLTFASRDPSMLLPCVLTPSISMFQFPGRLNAASAENTPSDCFLASIAMGPMPLSICVSFIVADPIPAALLPSWLRNDILKLFCPTAKGVITSCILPPSAYNILTNSVFDSSANADWPSAAWRPYAGNWPAGKAPLAMRDTANRSAIPTPASVLSVLA